MAIYGQGIKKVVVQEADLYPVATYSFLFALEYGRAINARKVFWAVRPSLDAPRTHHILPINHSADKRSDWVRVSFKRHSRQGWEGLSDVELTAILGRNFEKILEFRLEGRKKENFLAQAGVQLKTFGPNHHFSNYLPGSGKRVLERIYIFAHAQQEITQPLLRDYSLADKHQEPKLCLQSLAFQFALSVIFSAL